MDDASSRAMRAVVTDQGAPGRLKLSVVPLPEPAPGEALVRVQAVSMNRGEVRTALAAVDGWRPGWDFAGMVERAAVDGSGPPEGARVVGMAPAAAWSEYVVAAAPAMARLPDGVSVEDAAVLPVAGLTARAALARGGNLEGRRVLVTGASGGVGVLAIQLAAQAGARVTAAIRNAANAPLVKGLGAHAVAIGDDLAAAGQSFDLILESVGAATLGAALGLLAPGGACVLFGASSGSSTTFDTARFRVGGTSLHGLVMSYEFRREPPGVGLADLLDLLAAGRLRPMIERRAPIAEIATVAEDLIHRRFVGKAVLSL